MDGFVSQFRSGRLSVLPRKDLQETRLLSVPPAPGLMVDPTPRYITIDKHYSDLY